MTRGLWMKILAAMLVVALTAVLNPAWAIADPATFSGRVLGEDARTPLAGAVVQLTDASDEHTAVSKPSSEDGTFELTGLAPGVYRVVVETEQGLYQVTTSLRLEAGQNRSVHMALKTDREAVAGVARGGGGAINNAEKTLVGFGILLGTFAIAEAIDDNPKKKKSPSAIGD